MKYKVINKEEFNKETDEIFTLLREADQELSKYVFIDTGGNDVSIDWKDAYDLEKKVGNAFMKLGNLRFKYLKTL